MSRVKSSYSPDTLHDTGQIKGKMSKKIMRRLLQICRQDTTALNKDEMHSLENELSTLLENESINLGSTHPRSKGSVPLCEACRCGNEWAVDLLLQKGANVNLCDKNKCSPVYIAASHGHRTILQKLIDHGADINIKNLQGYLPLLSAVENNHVESAQLLIDRGADVNIQRPNTYGFSMSLMTFVLFAKSDIPFAERLLEAGVIPHAFEKPLNFILLEYGDENREFIKKLVYAGFNFYCEGWIKMARQKLLAELAEVTENEQDMMTFLEFEYRNPPRLERLCRTSIRTCLAMSKIKCHIREKVDRLPLPNEIKKYLKLKYM